MKTFFLLPVLAFSASVFATSPTTPASNPHAGMNLPALSAPEARPMQQATVLSTVSAPPYIYIEAAQGKNTVWLAATSVAVKKGDVVQFDQDMVMSNFYSKTLKRTFPSVIFVSRLTVGGKK
ncbi:MAG: hypothetical protein Q8Q28_06385 [Pseudomonadota bacterium]|nr:hypothetical protein [Pseudomonadota bacterium]